jgi:transcriptional regulator with XRE-family HTH domain
MRIWLKELRKQRGYTARALGREVGVSTEVVYRWESGANNPTDENKAALARALGDEVYGHFDSELRRLAAALGIEPEQPAEGAA